MRFLEIVAKIRDWTLVPLVIPLVILGTLSDWLDEEIAHRRHHRESPESHGEGE